MASDKLKTYDSDQVAVIFGGFALSGFAKGSKVKVERDTESWKDDVGSDGEVVRSKMHDRRGKITLRLMQTSESNAILSGFLKSDDDANGGVQAVTVKDNSGSSLHTGAQAWIQKPADSEFEEESKEREWVIRVAHLQMFEGGN